MGQEFYGVRWRNFKLVMIDQRHMSDAAARLPVPRLINLTTDPHEHEHVSLPDLHTLVAYHSLQRPHHSLPGQHHNRTLSSLWPHHWPTPESDKPTEPAPATGNGLNKPRSTREFDTI